MHVTEISIIHPPSYSNYAELSCHISMAENRDKAAEQTSTEEAAMDMDEGTETMETTEVENRKPHENIKETKKVTWEKLQRVDSLNLEAGRISWDHGQPSKVS